MNLLSQLQPKKANAFQQAIARHEDFIDKFIEILSTRASPQGDEREVTVIARSPASPVARAVMARGEELRQRGARIKIIFAELGADGEMAACAETLQGLHAGGSARESFRWARNACLLDAHEQLILGSAMCWSGDCMRRDPGKIDALDLFEHDAPKAVKLGVLAFDAIWAICEIVPASRLRITPASAAATNDVAERPSPFSFLRRSERPRQVAH